MYLSKRPFLPIFCSSFTTLFSLGLGWQLWGQPVSARPVPDNTLGDESPRIRSVGDIRDVIEGGAIRGNILFQSFGEFNIDEGREAYFEGSTAIEHILSRVTGDDPSKIFGTLGVLGDANLFFLNPNGIIFGPDSQLDINGSFVASTAERFTFPDGSSFSAVNPEAPPLLTMSISPGLQYGAQQPASLISGGILTVGQGQNLTLTGGTVVSNGELVAPGGNVSVAAVPSNSLVELGGAGELLTWSVFPDISAEIQPNSPSFSVTEMLDIAEIDRSNLPVDILPGTTLISGLVDVSDVEQIGGSVQILGERVGLLDADLNASGLLGGGTALIGGNYQGQGPLPNALRTYVDAFSSLHVDALEHGNGGQAVIWADGRTDFYGEATALGGAVTGNGGLVEISGRDTLVYDGAVDTSAPNGKFGTVLFDPFNITIKNAGGGNDDGEIGNGDEIINRTDGFDGAFFRDFTISKDQLEELENANANVMLQAMNDITLEDLDDNELRFEDGPGGAITFDAGGNFSMHPTDTILAFQRSVNILADNITIGSIRTDVPLEGEGNGGNINLTARTGNIIVQGFFDAASVNPNDVLPTMLGTSVSKGVNGNAGAVTLTAQGDIRFQGTFDGQQIAQEFINAGGNPDDINIQDPSVVSAFVSIPIEDDNGNLIGGNGDGGAITITSNNGAIINDLTVIDRSGSVIPRVAGQIDSTTPSGIGGAIALRADGNIDVGDVESFVTVEIGNGDGGPITIVSNSGSVNTARGGLSSATPNGIAGPITITANEDITTATIQSAAFNTGNGGRVTLNAGRNLSASTISSYADDGIGGIIDIDIASGNINNIDAINTGPFIGNEFGGAVDIDITNGNIIDIGSINTAFTGGNSGLVDINVGGNINDIGIIGTNSASGNDASVALNASGDITLNSIFTGDGSLEVTGRTIEQQTGNINVNGNAAFDSTQAEVGNIVINNSSFSSTGTRLGSSQIGGSLRLTTRGDVTQVPGTFLQVAGDTFVNGDPDPTLDNSDNFIPALIIEDPSSGNNDVIINRVGKIDISTDPGIPSQVTGDLIVNSITTGPIEFTEVYDQNGNAIALNGNNAFSGTINLNTDFEAASDPPTGIPEITQTGSQQVNGQAIFNAGNTGNITLDNPDNQFGDVGFIGNNVSIRNQLGTNIVESRDGIEATTGAVNTANSSASGNLQITSGGAITQESLLTVGGDALFTTSLTNLGSVAFNSINDIILDNSAIGGNLDLESGGTVTQAPGSILRVAGEVDIDAPGDVDLTNSQNTVPPLVLPDGDVVITQVGPIDLLAQTVSGNLTVNSVATGERFLDAFTPSAIALNNPDNFVQGTVSFNTALPGTEPISGTPEITQSGPQLVNGIATFNAPAGNIALPNASNQFGDVAFNGVDISLREDGSMNLLRSEATGRVNLIADDAITQTSGLAVRGRVRLETLLRNGFIRLDAPDNSLAGRIQFITQEAGSVELQNTLATQLARSNIGKDLTITSGGDITQTGRLVIAGVTTLDAGSNDIILDRSGNDFEAIAILGGLDVSLTEANSVQLNFANTGRNFTVIADNQITASGAAIAAGGSARGNLTFTAPSVVLRNGSIVANQTTQTRPGGNIFINAPDLLRLQGSVLLANVNTPDVNQRAGDVSVETGDLVLRNGSIISSSVLSNQSSSSRGSGGNLTVTANRVDIQDVAVLDLVQAFIAFREAGVQLNESPLQISPSRLATTTNDIGDAGRLVISARELNLQDGGIIATATATDSLGSGGNLTINVDDIITVSGTQDITPLFTEFEDRRVELEADFPNLAVPQVTEEQRNPFVPSLIATDTLGNGQAGNLRIRTGQLLVRNGAAVSSSTSSDNAEAVGGQATIIASDGILLEGTAPNGLASGLYAQSFADARAGDMTIQIRDGDLILRDRAKVTAASGSASDARLPIGLPPFNTRETEATGNAGELVVESESIFMSDDSIITAETAAGEGGNIEIRVNNSILLENNSDIRAIARGTGNGGNITLIADIGIFSQLSEDNDIIANAFEGDGGNIFASAPLILSFRQFEGVETPESDFVASSDFGRDGAVNVETDDSLESEDLPVDLAVPEVNQGCLTSQRSRSAQFRNVGREGLSINPYEPLSNSGIVDDIRLPRYLDSSFDIQNIGDAVNANGQITEAHYWSTDDAGNTILIADNTPGPESDRPIGYVSHCQIR
ncbi:MAG: filamentous hemagglutinin N-terminal domain-containing protein [Cyanobacteria bacterium P01_F01_bin.150]